MTSPFTDDYRNGDMVQCQRCAKNVRVKYYDKDTVVVVSSQDQQTLALRCQYCGYVLCDSCAHPADSLFPICPSCQREWGPYYFTHEVISPSLSKPALVEDVPPAEQPQPQIQPPVQPPVFEAPPAPIESIGAGETDLYGEYRDWERKKKFKKILLLVLSLLLLIFLGFLALGPGKPVLKKGFNLLNARPTRSPTMLALLNNTSTPAGKTTSKPTTPAPRVSPTPVKSSVTPATIIGAKPTNKFTATSAPTRTKAAKASPTITETSEPTSTATIPGPTDCVPALSITMNDLGKTLCVTGTVVFTLQKDNAFSIYFSNDDGYFRIVVYDRTYNNIKKGVCVKVIGEIKTLTSIPVMALGYNDVIEICSP
jgi:DNA-directed RNA polymerase subunit RPC12/RpoP